MVDESDLMAFLASICQLQAQERTRTKPRRRRGMLRRTWNTTPAAALALPPALMTFDELVPMTMSEAMAAFWLFAQAHNVGAGDSEPEIYAAITASFSETIATLAAKDEYLALHGVWIAAHRAGMVLDHGAIAQRILEIGGAAASAKYANEASTGAMILEYPRLSLLPTASELTH